MILSSALYFATRPNYDRIYNDLKHSYIKMKGDTTPESIAELEEIFELNHGNAKIRQMKKNAEEYERTIKQKVQLEEQVRRKAGEVQNLTEKANSIKKK